MSKLLSPIASLGSSAQEIYAVFLQNPGKFLKAKEIADIINRDRASSGRTERRVQASWVRTQMKKIRRVVKVESSKSRINGGYKL
jgi:hypothetical protein